MGCDIHVYVENQNDDGSWTYVGEPPVVEYEGTEDEYVFLPGKYVSRNYWLFGLLHGGVRTEWPFSFQGKIFPGDASPEVAAEYKREEGDAHSASYLSRAEIQLKLTELLITPDPKAGEIGMALKDLYNGLNDFEPPPNNDPARQRIVFWFDN